MKRGSDIILCEVVLLEWLLYMMSCKVYIAWHVHIISIDVWSICDYCAGAITGHVSAVLLHAIKLKIKLLQLITYQYQYAQYDLVIMFWGKVRLRAPIRGWSFREVMVKG